MGTVAARWYELRKRRETVSFRKAVGESLIGGAFLATSVLVLVVCSWTAFVVVTVYVDHQELVTKIKSLKQTKIELADAIELRKHSLVTGDPVFVNTIYLLMAFDGYRHYQHSKPCVVMLTAPPQSAGMASMVAQFSNSVSDCFTFGANGLGH